MNFGENLLCAFIAFVVYAIVTDVIKAIKELKIKKYEVEIAKEVGYSEKKGK